MIRIHNRFISKREKVFGTMSINILNGERTVHRARAIVLCTGGHTRIWKRSSSRVRENTEGTALCLKAGGELVDMEMVQFHPTGMLYPDETAGTLVTEAVRVKENFSTDRRTIYV